MDVEKIINSVVARFIGTKHERDVKELQPLVAEINALEPDTRKLSDAEITAKTATLKTEVQARMEGLERDDPDYKQRLQEALQPALVPAFALVREAGRRTLGMRHFDVQLIGGAGDTTPNPTPQEAGRGTRLPPRKYVVSTGEGSLPGDHAHAHLLAELHRSADECALPLL